MDGSAILNPCGYVTDRRTDEESINKKQRSQIDGERALPEGQKLRRLCDYREVDLDCHNIMLALAFGVRLD